MTKEELIRVIRHNEQLKADVVRLKRQVKSLEKAREEKRIAAVDRERQNAYEAMNKLEYLIWCVERIGLDRQWPGFVSFTTLDECEYEWMVGAYINKVLLLKSEHGEIFAGFMLPNGGLRCVWPDKNRTLKPSEVKKCAVHLM